MVALALPYVSFAAEELTTKQRAQKVEQYYKAAEKAYEKGDLTKTREALQRSLALNPNHGPSYALAIKVRQNKSSFSVKARQTQMARVILPVVDFQAMPLEDVLRDLGDLIEKESKDSVIPNFVLIDKNGTIKSKNITLNMKQVPATVVLDYVMNMAGARAKFDQYSITVRPAN